MSEVRMNIRDKEEEKKAKQSRESKGKEKHNL
jgi:hypothetical protein